MMNFMKSAMSIACGIVIATIVLGIFGGAIGFITCIALL